VPAAQHPGRCLNALLPQGFPDTQQLTLTADGGTKLPPKTHLGCLITAKYCSLAREAGCKSTSDTHVPKSQATEEHQNNEHVDQAAKIEVAHVDLDWQHKNCL